jgi:hypothetical protein
MSGRGHWPVSVGGRTSCLKRLGGSRELTDEASCNFQGLQIAEGKSRLLIGETKFKSEIGNQHRAQVVGYISILSSSDGSGREVHNDESQDA